MAGTRKAKLKGRSMPPTADATRAIVMPRRPPREPGSREEALQAFDAFREREDEHLVVDLDGLVAAGEDDLLATHDGRDVAGVGEADALDLVAGDGGAGRDAEHQQLLL